MVSSRDASEHASKKVQEKGTAALFNATAPFLYTIGATRKTGGSNWGYKPPLLTRASRRGFSLCSSLSVIATLAAPKGAYLTNESSYSFTLSLSRAISCFSCS